ncbi:MULTISPECIES: ABC transporter permease subunit [Micromonospora]|uniref:ABC transporter permease n=1 Tax=Micromonospora solifontis TaxID=2487138 RepID=A0ABX9WE01_9ACTN|nr:MULTISPECIES: ABC transporter permease subunit [Micromonospora]NES16725.1 ABC transporter permease subunit [Micromonospora sp. PPF5-17B]NES37707.1 ABC transporter permease subunit [Micromonospora solifontis]NES58445.1 ABC transporter permease subunit [Micromonospora sp. PPF5-6]RNL98053.1 ABC transporter permease [Micromonospora solifontis]
MSLFVTELRRLAKRRVTRLLLVLLVLGLAGVATAFSFSSHKLSKEVVAAAQVEADHQYRQAVKDWERTVADCDAAKARGEATEERFGPNCGRDWQPQPEMFDPKWNLPYQFDFRAEFPTFIAVFAGAVALFAFIVGASFVGAEWSTGGMMNLLLWRPKRLAVLGTKMAALLTTVLGVTVVLGAFWTLAFWLIGRYRGTTVKVTAGVWRSIGLDGLRAVGIVLAIGAIAFALASLGRHTAMALGAAVAVFAISEIGIRIAVGVLSIPFGDRYVLSTYAQAWFMKQVKLFDYDACQFAKGQCEPAELLVTWQDSALVFGLGAAVVLVAAFWAMRKRDIA